MKTIFLALFIFIYSLSFSQFQTGLKGGLNLSGITNNNCVFRDGVIFGVSEIYHANKFLLKSGLFYQGSGFKKRDELTNSVNVYKLDFIQLPLSVSYLFSNKSEQPFIDLGLFSSYLLGSRTVNLDNKTSINSPQSNMIDYGASLAAGMGFSYNGKLKFIAEVKFSQGFNTFYNGYNQSLSVTGNVLF
jgi:hypothetical protein